MTHENPVPLGVYEWVARLRDGTTIREITLGVQCSIDDLASLDVAELHLVPLRSNVTYTVIQARPDERVRKKWVRTFTATENGAQSEHPVIDAYWLETTRTTYHYTSWNGNHMVQVITSSEEP